MDEIDRWDATTVDMDSFQMGYGIKLGGYIGWVVGHNGKKIYIAEAGG